MSKSTRMFQGVLAAAALAAATWIPATNPALAEKETAAELKDLAGLDELKTLFNAAEGSPRLLVLLSPT